jgi:hypothetical protein
VKVNFDPANMILYGAGDPIDAIAILGRHIAHVHVKDATLSNSPGRDVGRGSPVRQRTGPPRNFCGRWRMRVRGPLVIEREAGDQRMEDVAFAIETLKAGRRDAMRAVAVIASLLLFAACGFARRARADDEAEAPPAPSGVVIEQDVRVPLADRAGKARPLSSRERDSGASLAGRS